MAPARNRRSTAAVRKAAPAAPAKLAELRFRQGDRVVCNLGDRWAAGRVLSVNVEDPEDPQERLPYVVKTDHLPRLGGSRTISVPGDNDRICTREVCFPVQEWAADASPVYPRAKDLRFAPGDAVAFRVYDAHDGLACWAEGRVVQAWPQVKGQIVPYLLAANFGGNYWAHLDDHTLVRLPANKPRQRGRGVAGRLEVREMADGTLEKFDHVTLQGRPMHPGSPAMVLFGAEEGDSD